MKVVAFVPVKLNNERLPGKNTKCFTGGEPLIAYILKSLLQVNGLDEIYVYCSSDEICDYLPEGIRFQKRDPYYDLSSTPFNEVLWSFAQLVPADVYLLTHATAPFMSPESMEKGIEAVKSGKFDSALSVLKMQEFIWKDGKPMNYDPRHIPRTQDLDPLYRETCGLYVYRSHLIKEEKRRIGDTPYLIEVSDVEACDINTAGDFLIADAVFQTINERK